jgi:hypothetical protein
MGPLSSWTDEPKNREQPALFSEEVARGEKDLEEELRAGGDESRPYQYCPFCWQPVDRREADTFFEATVWLRGLHKDSATLREYSGQAAHGKCVKSISDSRRAPTPSPDSGDNSVVAVRDAEIPGQLVLIDVRLRSRDGVMVISEVPTGLADRISGAFNGSIGFTASSSTDSGVLT